MQAVILAAGRGTRMGALTESTPKPMLKVHGKNLLEHKIDALPEHVDEVIFVVGYLKEVVQDYFGSLYKGKRIAYVEQKNIVGGTADALWQARPLLTERFLVMMGDDIYAKNDISAVCEYDWAVLLQHAENTKGGGVAVVEHNLVRDVVEASHHSGAPGFICTNLFALDARIFDFPQVPKSEGSTEVGLPQTVVAASRASNIPLQAVEATEWIQITSPEDLAKAEKLLAA